VLCRVKAGKAIDDQGNKIHPVWDIPEGGISNMAVHGIWRGRGFMKEKFQL